MDFKLQISPRMLELLSKDLYTNIYFVLAELIANSYDADAENVYVDIEENCIRVEDDGAGMDPETLNSIYLYVGGETRNNEENSRTKIKKRLKMGRKGIGKLAALSISNGFQLITKSNGIVTAIYIPSKIEKEDEILRVLNAGEYELKHITTSGTAVIMNSPKIHIPSLSETVVNNLSRIFPSEIDDFHIHVNYKGKISTIKPDEKTIIPRLATLITIGDEYKFLENSLDKNNKNIQYSHKEKYSKTIQMMNSFFVESPLPIEIKGWIGTYKTTRGMKKDINEFSDNYLAVFAHKKMGQRNILNIISKNRVYESYVVGNLYIDAFEESSFPDMAGTNRQGYNENDPRWIAALEFIRPLLDEIVKMHKDYSVLESEEVEKRKQDKKEMLEQQLKKKVAGVSVEISNNIISGIKEEKDIEKLVSQEVEKMKPLLGLKATVDSNKKKIIISQTFLDKKVADVVYKMLLFNGVPKDVIIYSNSDDPEANLPEGDIYDYLRKFFVESVSDEKIYVLFITSSNVFNVDGDKNSSSSWGVLMEIGATWITQKDHWIFNRDGFIPKHPLKVEQKIVEIKTVSTPDGSTYLSLSSSACNSFVNKIMITCQECGFEPRSFNDNKKYLTELVTIFEPQ